MTEYRDCHRCEKLRDENQKLAQSMAEAKARASAARRWNVGAFAVATGVVAMAIPVGMWIHGMAMRPPKPKVPEPCVESVQIVADGYQHECHNGASMLVSPMQAADKVLVRCECTDVIHARTDGGP